MNAWLAATFRASDPTNDYYSVQTWDKILESAGIPVANGTGIMGTQSREAVVDLPTNLPDGPLMVIIRPVIDGKTSISHYFAFIPT